MKYGLVSERVTKGPVDKWHIQNSIPGVNEWDEKRFYHATQNDVQLKNLWIIIFIFYTQYF